MNHDSHQNKCNYCGKTFARTFCLNRHLKDRCKIKNQIDNLESIIEALYKSKIKVNNKEVNCMLTYIITEFEKEILQLKSQFINIWRI